MRLLVIDEHRPSARRVKRLLEEQGFGVDVAYDGRQGDDKAQRADYDVIILEPLLSGGDGFSLLRCWRQAGRTAHVLLLTALAGVEHKVRGFNLGADDYLTKPFDARELGARLRALTRRAHPVEVSVLRVHDLEVDTAAHAVRRAGRPIYLTRREYALLELLALHHGRVVTRPMIWQRLYGEADKSRSNIVNVYIGYLRNKIDKGFDLPLILTHWGQGYMLKGGQQTGSPIDENDGSLDR